MANFPRQWRRRYVKSVNTPNPPLMTGRTLGDKLHELAQKSPAHVRAVEVLVDRMLEQMAVPRPREELRCPELPSLSASLH